MVKLENISKKFGNIYIIDNINLTFAHKECTAIIGPSGSGKSTLLRCICMLENINKGKILINNQQVNKYNKKNS